MLKKLKIIALSAMLFLVGSVGAQAFNLAGDDILCTSRTKTVYFYIAAISLAEGNQETSDEFRVKAFEMKEKFDKDVCFLAAEGFKAKVLPGSFQWELGNYRGKTFHITQIMVYGDDGGAQFYYVVRELITNIEKDNPVTRDPKDESKKKEEKSIKPGKKFYY